MSGTGVEELQLLIRSGWSLIALESCEEDRALSLLHRIAKTTERSFLPWTLASGFEARPELCSGSERAPRKPGKSTSNSFNECLLEIDNRDGVALGDQPVFHTQAQHADQILSEGIGRIAQPVDHALRV